MQAVPSPCDYGVEISRVFLLQWDLELDQAWQIITVKN